MKLTVLLPILFMLLPMEAFSQLLEPKYIAGQDYALLEDPVPTRDKSKVEVVEVFWYGCSHCFSFEPLIKSWKAKQPEDVDFWQSPAMWNGRMKLHAQAFYTAESLGVMDTMHQPLFNALILERNPLSNQKQIADLFEKNGVDKEKFNKAFKSFGVTSKVKQADARARAYKISGTPEVIVNGKYRVTARLAKGQGKMFDIIDFLVNKERATLASK